MIATNTNNVIILRSLSAPEQSKHLRPNVFIRQHGTGSKGGREGKGREGAQGCRQGQRQRQRALLVSAAIAAHKSQATAASPHLLSPSSLGIAHCHLSRRRRRCRRVQLFDFAVGGCNKYNKRGSRHFWLSSRHLDAERVQSPSRNSFPGSFPPSPPHPSLWPL